MNKYKKVLNLFVSNDELRPWMQNPFTIKDKIYATNGYALVVFDLVTFVCNNYNTTLNKITDIPIIYQFEEDKLNGVYPLENNLNNTYSINFLKKRFKNVPLIDDFDEEKKIDICTECGGTGVVTYVYEDDGYIDHEMDGTCPICDGFSKCEQIVKKPNGKTVLDKNAQCIIGNSIFYVNKIKYILDVAEILGVSKFELVYQKEEYKASLFKVGEADLLIMPAHNLGNNIAFKIK